MDQEVGCVFIEMMEGLAMMEESLVDLPLTDAVNQVLKHTRTKLTG